MFLKTVFPENMSMQLYRLTAPLKARKSHPNMIVDPTTPLPIMIIKLIFSLCADYIFLLFIEPSCSFSC